ncbi:hypothetical protein TGCAST_254160A [Toxoplasma gondii CAST]|uniref:Uncharacterized protein n=1 Tax=Toxoplasma gondii CAST TaxID=943122 RepID=A0A3R7YLV4_TOXGO|nr:hypothetical protein TGCAST_254160A [Toxoplasma gondii CAST]
MHIRRERIPASFPTDSSNSSAAPSTSQPVPPSSVPNASSTLLPYTEDKRTHSPAASLYVTHHQAPVATRSAAGSASSSAATSSSFSLSPSSVPCRMLTSPLSDTNRSTAGLPLSPTVVQRSIAPHSHTAQSPRSSKVENMAPLPRRCVGSSSSHHGSPMLSSPPPPHSPSAARRERQATSHSSSRSTVAAGDPVGGCSSREESAVAPLPFLPKKREPWSVVCPAPPLSSSAHSRAPLSGSATDQQGEDATFHRSQENAPRKPTAKARDAAASPSSLPPVSSSSVSAFRLGERKLQDDAHQRRLRSPGRDASFCSLDSSSSSSPLEPSSRSSFASFFPSINAAGSVTPLWPQTAASSSLPDCGGNRQVSRTSSDCPTQPAFHSEAPSPCSSTRALPRSSPFHVRREADSPPELHDGVDSKLRGRVEHSVQEPLPFFSSPPPSVIPQHSPRSTVIPASAWSRRSLPRGPSEPDADLGPLTRSWPRRRTEGEDETEPIGEEEDASSRSRGIDEIERERRPFNCELEHRTRARALQGQREGGERDTDWDSEMRQTERRSLSRQIRSQNSGAENISGVQNDQQIVREPLPWTAKEQLSGLSPAGDSSPSSSLTSHRVSVSNPLLKRPSVYFPEELQNCPSWGTTFSDLCRSPHYRVSSVAPGRCVKPRRLRFRLPTPCRSSRATRATSTERPSTVQVSMKAACVSLQYQGNCRSPLPFSASSSPPSSPPSSQCPSETHSGFEEMIEDVDETEENSSSSRVAIECAAIGAASSSASAEEARRDACGKAKEKRRQKRGGGGRGAVSSPSLRTSAPCTFSAWPSAPPFHSRQSSSSLAASEFRDAPVRTKRGNLTVDRRRAQTCEEAFVLATERAFGVTWREAVEAVKKKAGMFRRLQTIFAEDETRFRVGMRLWAEEFLAAERNAGEERGRHRRRRGQGDTGQERAEAGERRRTTENTDELRDPGKTRDGPCGNQARSQSMHASEETPRVLTGRLLDDLVKAMAKDWKKLPIVLDIFREGAFFCGSPFLPPNTNDSITAFSSSSTSSSDRCGLRASALASPVCVSSSISSHLLLYLRVLSSFLLQLDHFYRDLGGFLPRLVRSSSASAASSACSPPLITELARLLHAILSSAPSLALPTAYAVSPSARLPSAPSFSSSRSSPGRSYLSTSEVCCVSPPYSGSTSSAPWMASPRFSRRLPAFWQSSRTEHTEESTSVSYRTTVRSAKAEESLASLGDLVAQLLAFLGKEDPRRFLREVIPSALNADEEAFALVALRLVPLWGEGLRSLLQGAEKTKRKKAEHRRTDGGFDKRGPLETVLHQREERGELETDESEEKEGRNEEKERTTREDPVRNNSGVKKTYRHEEAMRHTHTGYETANLDEAWIETWTAATEYLLQFCCSEISVLSLAPAAAREASVDTGKSEEEISPGTAAFSLSKSPLLLHLALLVNTLRHLGPFLVSPQTAGENAAAAETRDIETHAQPASSEKRRRKEKNTLVQALNHLSNLLRHPRATVRQAASWHTATLLVSCWSSHSSRCGSSPLVSPPAAVGFSPLHSLLSVDTKDGDARDLGEKEAKTGGEPTEGTKVNEAARNARGPLALRREVQNAQGEARGAANSGKKEGEIEKSCTCRAGIETAFSPLALLPLLWETKVVSWEGSAEQSEESRHGVKERESEEEEATERADRAYGGKWRSRLDLQTPKQNAWQPEPAQVFLHLLEEDRRVPRIDTPAVLAHALPALLALRPTSLRPLHLDLLAAFLLHPRTDRGAAQQILDVLAEVYIRNIRCSFASRFSAGTHATDPVCSSSPYAPLCDLDSSLRPLGSEAVGEQGNKKNDLGDTNGPIFPSTQHGILSVLFLAFCFSPSLRESCWLSTWLPSFLDQEETTLQAEMQRQRTRSQLSSAKQLERLQTPQQAYPPMEAGAFGGAAKFLLGRVEEEERRSRERRRLARSHGDGEEADQRRACDREGDQAAHMKKKEVLQNIRILCETHLGTLPQGREESRFPTLEANDEEAEEKQKGSPSAKLAAFQQPDRDLRPSVSFEGEHLGEARRRHSTEKDANMKTEVTARRENKRQPAVRSTPPRPSSISSFSSPRVSPQSPASPCCVAAVPRESAFEVEAAGGRTSPVCLVPVREALADVEARRPLWDADGRGERGVGEKETSDMSLQERETAFCLRDACQRGEGDSKGNEESREHASPEEHERNTRKELTSFHLLEHSDRRPLSPAFLARLSSSFCEESRVTGRHESGREGRGRQAEEKREEETASPGDAAAEEECCLVLTSFRRTVAWVLASLQEGETPKRQPKDVISTSTLPRLLPLFQLSADSENREVLFASCRLLKQRQKCQMDDPRSGDATGSGVCGRGAGGQDALPLPPGPIEISQDELGLVISQLALLTGQREPACSAVPSRRS